MGTSFTAGGSARDAGGGGNSEIRGRFALDGADLYAPSSLVIGDDVVLQALNASTGNALSAFAPDFTGGSVVAEIRTLEVFGNKLFVGGFFDNINGQTHQRFATFTLRPEPQGPPPPAVADRIAPTLTGFKLRKPRFSQRRGTKIVFRCSEAGTATFAFQRRKGKKLRRAGSFRRAVKAGRNSFTFKGKVGRRRLKPGRYRVTLTVRDRAGNRSRRVRRNFSLTR